MWEDLEEGSSQRMRGWPEVRKEGIGLGHPPLEGLRLTGLSLGVSK